MKYQSIGYTIAAGLTALYLGCGSPQIREEPQEKPRAKPHYMMSDLLQDNPQPTVSVASGCTTLDGRLRALCVTKSFMKELQGTAKERLFSP